MQYGFVVEDNQHAEVEIEVRYPTLPSDLQYILYERCYAYY